MHKLTQIGCGVRRNRATISLNAFSFVFICVNLCNLWTPPAGAEVAVLPFDVKLDTVVSYDGGDWIWFHPRAAAVPGDGKDGVPSVGITLQRHLNASDYYSGMYVMLTEDLGKTWKGPREVPELAWREGEGGETIAVCDATPGWHPQSRKILVFGLQLRYSKTGEQLEDKPRSLQTAYSVHDPFTRTWSGWRTIELKDNDTKFYISGPGCSQWIVQDNGNILLPIYYKSSQTGAYSVTVLKCGFDGETVRVLEYGNDMHLEVERGLCEPSIALYNGTYYLTIRNDVKGYVATSADGLHYGPMAPWTFDDGVELGSYNTQQHWLTHSDGLFLIYTRRGADNDNVFRNRAPLFMAQVDPEKLVVMRATEKVLMPNTGAAFGNFGATAVTAQESWVTDAEGIFGDALKPGVTTRVLCARIVWSKPNRLVETER